MSLEEKLELIDTLYFTDSSGVVWRLPTVARQQAEQLVRDNPRLSIPDLLPRITFEEAPLIPAFEE